MSTSVEIEKNIESIEKSFLPLEWYGIPALSIAVINEGEIEWAKAYGVLEADTFQLANTDSLFQAGLLSKPVAAYGILQLVSKRLLDLDAEIKLASWRIPEDKKITLRQLLTQPSESDPLGYPEGAKLPTLVEILKKVNCGYTLMQLLVEEVLQTSFASYMNEAVFDPLGMTNSTFQFLYQQKPNVATAHLSEINPMEGRWRIYPQRAAAGLWTTPTDLAEFLIHIQNSLPTSQIVQKMLTPVIPPYGLGFVIHGKDEQLRISHRSRTDGFTSGFIAFPHLRQGAVVMINADHEPLVDEILRAVSTVYNWPSHE